MESWRGYLNEIDANGDPETVGELLVAINKYTMIQGDVSKRILKTSSKSLRYLLTHHKMKTLTFQRMLRNL